MSHMVRFLFVLSAFLSTSAFAQTQDEDEEARGLYLAGQAAYDGARYGDAVERFQESYALSGRPELLFNIGHAAQLDGQIERALEAFERYLEEAPDGDKRDEVSERAENLRERLANRAEEPPEEARAEAQTHQPLPERNPPSHALPLALGLGGLGVAVGGGVFMGLMAGQQSTVRNAPDGTPWSDVSGNHDRARTFRTVGITMLGAGAVLAGIGLSVWLARRNTRLHVDAQGLRVSGSF